MSTFAQYANVPLPNVLTAIARIFGRGGSVFEPPSRRRNVSSREGADELDQAIAVIWGRSTSEEKWVKRLAGMQSLNDGGLCEAICDLLHSKLCRFLNHAFCAIFGTV
jgi:hypothetical protein